MNKFLSPSRNEIQHNATNTVIHCFVSKSNNIKPYAFSIWVSLEGSIVKVFGGFENYIGKPVQVLIADKKKDYVHHIIK